MFPYTNFGGPNSGPQLLDNQLKTPYAEIFNLSVQREVHRGMTLMATYAGRLGRHLISLEDIGLPENLADPASGQTWYGAATILDKAKDAGTSITAIQNIPYFQDVFPNASYTTQGVTYHGTQAVYGLLTRGGDVQTLFTLDSNAANSPSGQTKRFFHPQFQGANTESAIGVSNYNAIQLSLRHTLTKSFIYDINYTWSHSLDMVSNPERGNNLTSNAYGSNPESTINNAFNPSG